MPVLPIIGYIVNGYSNRFQFCAICRRQRGLLKIMYRMYVLKPKEVKPIKLNLSRTNKYSIKLKYIINKGASKLTRSCHRS